MSRRRRDSSSRWLYRWQEGSIALAIDPMERPQSHITDSRGKAQMRSVFESSGWTVNEIEHDYGVDFDVQLFENGEATGEWFKVQLKSSENTPYSAKGDFISEELSREHAVHFSAEMRDPIFVVHADVTSERTFWYAPQLDTPISLIDSRENITVRVPTRNKLPDTLPRLVSALRTIRIRLGAKTVAESSISDFATSIDDRDRARLITGIQDKVDGLRLAHIQKFIIDGSLDEAAADIENLAANSQSSVEIRFSAILEKERVEFLASRKAAAPQSTIPAIHLRTSERLQKIAKKGPSALKLFALIARKRQN
jgi:Domain of unknown function (DUF4365)